MAKIIPFNKENDHNEEDYSHTYDLINEYNKILLESSKEEYHEILTVLVNEVKRMTLIEFISSELKNMSGLLEYLLYGDDSDLN